MIALDFQGKTIVFKGDSITRGDGASSDSNRWTTLLCNEKNGVENNRGISGSGMESEIASYSCGKAAFQLSDVPSKLSTHKYLYLAYNTNDILVNRSLLTPTNFKNQLSTAIAGCIGKGWLAEEIVILNGFWIPNLGASYNECGVTQARTRTEAEQFVQASNEVAAQYATILADTYNATKNNSNYATVDNLHPNNTGHRIIADYLKGMDYSPYIIPHSVYLYGRRFITS